MNEQINSIVAMWDRQEKLAQEAELQRIADESRPKPTSRATKAVAFLAVCAACFVPAFAVGWANGGFDAAQAAQPVQTQEEAPEAAPEPAEDAPEAEPVRVVVPVTVAAKAPRKAEKSCSDHRLELTGGKVRVCDPVQRTGNAKPDHLPGLPWRQ